jgi:hypothetical protein
MYTPSTETSQNRAGAGNHDAGITTKTMERFVVFPVWASLRHLKLLVLYFQAILDPKTSQRIFELARDQQDELDHPDSEEDVIEDDFTRPRTRDLEEVDEEDEEDEFQGFSGDEERELVRYTIRLKCST